MAMDSSSAQSHHQEMGSQTLESMLVCTKSQQEKKPRPADHQALKCPRCESTNTKFCYYNNYSLSQPRYFCKSCRRYWTKGGTLRNIPVGGGCRKNKRSSSSSSQSSASSKRIHDQPITRSIPSPTASINPLSYELGLDIHGFPMSGNPNMPLSDSGLFDALRGGFLETPRGFHNLYYGMEDGVNLGLDNPGMGFRGNQEMGLMGFEELIISSGATATSTAVTTVKQEMCSNIGREGAEMSRGLWGFPWQNIVSGDGNMGDLDSTRLGSWNGIASSNWHGLLNSPLM